MNIKERQRKQRKHLAMARQHLAYLTPKRKKEEPEQYENHLMSATSLAMQAHHFLPSYRTKKLLKILESK